MHAICQVVFYTFPHVIIKASLKEYITIPTFYGGTKAQID